MKNQIEVHIDKPDFSIKSADKIFSIGSCFSSEISKSLFNKGIFVLNNPFGTIYNTYSIFQVFNILFNSRVYNESDLIFYSDKYFSFDHSTEFDGSDKKKCLKKINNNIKRSREYLLKSKVFIITLGTSVVWKNENKITANCHKLPQNLFNKKILTLEENFEFIKQTITLIKKNIKNPKIIFTLSPVRHNKNNLVENSYSKALLRVSIEQFVDNKTCYYFPSYEIVLDQLRNYSFYKKDMMHIKKATAQFICEKFINIYFDKKLLEFIKKFKKIKKTLLHKTQGNKSENTYLLLKQMISKIEELEKVNNSKTLLFLKYLISLKLLNFIGQKEIKEDINKMFNEKNKIYVLFKLIFDKKIDEIKKMKFKNKMLKKIRLKFLYHTLRNGF